MSILGIIFLVLLFIVALKKNISSKTKAFALSAILAIEIFLCTYNLGSYFVTYSLDMVIVIPVLLILGIIFFAYSVYKFISQQKTEKWHILFLACSFVLLFYLEFLNGIFSFYNVHEYLQYRTLMFGKDFYFMPYKLQDQADTIDGQHANITGFLVHNMELRIGMDGKLMYRVPRMMEESTWFLYGVRESEQI
jgi:hypothetical protein